jgi:hypothetical protein
MGQQDGVPDAAQEMGVCEVPEGRAPLDETEFKQGDDRGRGDGLHGVSGGGCRLLLSEGAQIHVLGLAPNKIGGHEHNPAKDGTSQKESILPARIRNEPAQCHGSQQSANPY